MGVPSGFNFIIPTFNTGPIIGLNAPTMLDTREKTEVNRRSGDLLDRKDGIIINQVARIIGILPGQEEGRNLSITHQRIFIPMLRHIPIQILKEHLKIGINFPS
jgi:hypothetical protein